MANSTIPPNIRRAASRFHRQRAQYYQYLASMLDASKGNTKISQLLERDAQRYDGLARGVLAGYWYDKYISNGGDLAEAWQGTLPDDEVTIIRVAKDAGEGALMAALGDIARVSMLSDKVRAESIGTIAAAVIGLTIALLMSTVFVAYAADEFLRMYKFVPFSEWGPKARAMVSYADGVKEYWLFVAAPTCFLFAYILWSINNLTGPTRDWLDQKVALYKTIRDIKGTLFLATMSTLTRKRGNVMYTLSSSLQTLAQSSRSPWFKWRIEEIIAGIESTGATGSEAFNTNLLSPEMYYFLRDTQEARGFSEGFDEVGKYVESTILGGIIKSMVMYRWIMFMVGVAIVVVVVSWNMSVIYEMNRIISSLAAR